MDIEAALGDWDAHFWIQTRLWDILNQIIGRDRRHRPAVLALGMNSVALNLEACTLAPGRSQGCCEQAKGLQPTHRSYKLASFGGKVLRKPKPRSWCRFVRLIKVANLRDHKNYRNTY